MSTIYAQGTNDVFILFTVACSMREKEKIKFVWLWLELILLESTWWKFKVLFKLLLLFTRRGSVAINIKTHIGQLYIRLVYECRISTFTIWWCFTPCVNVVVDKMALDWQHFVDALTHTTHTHTQHIYPATQFWFHRKSTFGWKMTRQEWKMNIALTSTNQWKNEQWHRRWHHGITPYTNTHILHYRTHVVSLTLDSKEHIKY